MPRGNVEVSISDSFHGAAARCPPAEQERRVFRLNPARHFSQCLGGTLKLAFRTLSMARRLVVRLPSRNAARLSSESCAAFQSMPRENIEVSIPDSFHGAAAH